MTLIEFIAKLKRHTKRHRVKWELRGGAANLIRTADGCLCPLEAVARKPIGRHCEAGKKLGLRPRQVVRILRAADSQAQEHSRWRRALLDAAGLREAV